MLTEQISPRYVDLDSWPTREMIAAMYEGQLAGAAAVRGALDAIAGAVDDAVTALRRGGRIVYVGAGTSGRIGVQDGTEPPPTYDWPADRLVFAMAGGLGMSVDTVARSPMALIGTSEEMVAELRRRQEVWDVREVVFQFQDEAVVRKFAREVIPAFRA